jgi:GYF domain 2
MQEKWWYKSSDVIKCPESLETLTAMLSKGTLRSDSPIWAKSIGKWMTAAELPEFQAVGDKKAKLDSARRSVGKNTSNKSNKSKPVNVVGRLKFAAI